MTTELVTQPTIDTVRVDVANYAQTVRAKVAEFEVTEQTFDAAGKLLLEIRGRRTQWKAFMAPHIDGAMDAKRVAEANRKRLVTDFETLDKPLAEAEGGLAKRIGDVEDALEKARQEAQRVLQAAADAEAVERTLAEAVALEEEALTSPVKADADVVFEEVEELLANPIPAAQVKVELPVQRVSGLQRPEQWSATLTSLPDLLTALVGGKLDRPLRDDLIKRISEAVMPPLNIRARALKSALAIPGVKAVSDRGYRIR